MRRGHRGRGRALCVLVVDLQPLERAVESGSRAPPRRRQRRAHVGVGSRLAGRGGGARAAARLRLHARSRFLERGAARRRLLRQVVAVVDRAHCELLVVHVVGHPLQAEVGGEGLHRVGRAAAVDPTGAELDAAARCERGGVQSAANSARRFEHEHRAAGSGEGRRRREASHAGADNDRVPAGTGGSCLGAPRFVGHRALRNDAHHENCILV